MNGKLLIALFLFLSFETIAQSVLEARLENVQQGQPLVEFLKEYEANHKVKFFYVEEWLTPYTMFTGLNGLPLGDALTLMFRESDINYVFLYDYAVILVKDPARELERKILVQKAEENRISVDQMTLGDKNKFTPGGRVTLHGTITSKDTKLPLTGATVFVNGLSIGTGTNSTGRYQLVIPGGEYVLSYRFINHEEKLVNLSIYQDGEINMQLEETPVTLDEVVIRDQNITDKRIGQTSIRMVDLRRSPSFMGEKDIIKQLQIQSGVSTVSEASSGFNVRGGGADQNLVLYDGVPIFNTSHALGFFTAFNSDAVSEASFYKGGIPAEYGGRVSSVLNMASREGDYRKWKGSAGIGLVSSNLTIGGPIKIDTSSLSVSLRTTYSDWILNVLKNSYRNISNSSIFFYDGSAKYTHKLNKSSKLTFSAYTSHDRFRLATDTANQWQNIALAARYEKTVTPNLFYSAGIYAGHYSYNLNKEEGANAFNLKYKITYPSLKIDFNHDKDRSKQSFGFHSTYYQFSPGVLEPTTPESTIKHTAMPIERSIESALYFTQAYTFNEKLNAEVGFRLSMFNRIGPGTVYLYKPDAPLTVRNTIDSVHYGPGQIMKTYIGPEPRASLRYNVGERSSVKLGYNRIYQYVHLISNTAAITPVDIWQSSNTYFKPQMADQISGGFFHNSRESTYETSFEVYYKKLHNVLDFKDGANLILNPQLETSLLPGKGKAYGAEFGVNKVKGKLVGGLNYTYARSLRKVNGQFDSEKIND
ncbi:MAG TPA: TonB-dependent receptor, partial [Cyclobacteriaceae bacterium]|nr:TonB-dependent receptor [Cyclobacteriaceae bacterium]